MNATAHFPPAPSSGAIRTGSRWERFVRYMRPWWMRKVEQGEAYVQALVEKEQASAEKIRAEARHHDADAAKAMAEADHIRAESWQIHANIAPAAMKELHSMRAAAAVSDAQASVVVEELLGRIRDDSERQRRLS